ncbi:hypothetical protein SAMN05920897_10113 [Alkalispirochaeta americana]|uniref:Uncharacterized protein n=2 Tax=Alkalispirochaeta americana TaxID=159291 RepID=A0A1N6N458_9SPIO|nr:hypothetical protein [Alkalispirochaeta americana]SIP86811.1 hypothetical protein SAMN05920897_10113 [Alkalispirochaeta americana]
MGAMVFGVALVLFAVYAVLPASVPFAVLNWGEQVLVVLAGGVPILALFIGLIAVMIGIADIKDKKEAKKEEAEEARAAAREKSGEVSPETDKS